MDIINCLSYAISFVLVFTAFQETKRSVILRLMLYIFMVEYSSLQLGLEQYSTLPISIFAAAYIYWKAEFAKQSPKLYLCIFFAFLTTIIQAIVTLTAAAILMFYDNRLYATLPYNLIIAFSLLIFGILFKHFLKNKFHVFRMMGMFKQVAIAGFYVLCISVLVPVALAFGTDRQLRFTFYVIYAFALFITLIIFFRVNQTRAENETLRQNELKNKAAQEILINAYKEFLSYKHYYNKLYDLISQYISDGDMVKLRSFYQTYVGPVHEELISNPDYSKTINRLKNTLIHNLVLDTVLRVTHIYNKEITVFVHQDVYIRNIEEFTLYKLLTIFLNNAIEHIENTADGAIEIVIEQELRITHIIIRNTLENEKDIPMLKLNTEGYTTKTGHDGQGLAIAKELIQTLDTVQHMNYIENGLFVQHLVIGGGG